FQRLSVGTILLVGFVLDYWGLVFFVTLLLGVFLVLPPEFSPFYRLYLSIKGKERTSCACVGTEVRAGCIFGISLLALALVFKSLNLPGLARPLVFLVSALSIVAGVSDFCLGWAVYLLLKRAFSGE
ncbi:MAG: hypothetical protein D6778_07115, partial [Nitrospirae bacterium]